MSTVYSAVLPPSLLVFFLIKLLSSVQTLQQMDFFSFLFHFEQQKSHLFLIKLLSSVQTLQLPAQFVLWHHRPKNMEQKMLPGKLVWKRVPTPTQALFKRRCHQMNLFGINDIRMRNWEPFIRHTVVNQDKSRLVIIPVYVMKWVSGNYCPPL